MQCGLRSCPVRHSRLLKDKRPQEHQGKQGKYIFDFCSATPSPWNYVNLQIICKYVNKGNATAFVYRTCTFSAFSSVFGVCLEQSQPAPFVTLSLSAFSSKLCVPAHHQTLTTHLHMSSHFQFHSQSAQWHIYWPISFCFRPDFFCLLDFLPVTTHCLPACLISAACLVFNHCLFST